jgi:hypothetical protein
VYSRRLLAFTLLLAVAVVVAVHALDFPGSVPDFSRSSGGGLLLDVKPSFSVEAIYQRLSQYGEKGRENYAFRNLTVDVLLPLAVFPALFLSMLHASKRLSTRPLVTALMLSLPFSYVICDFVENGIVLALLASFPDRLQRLAGILPYVTVVKRTASLLALAVPVVIFIVVLARGRRVKV